MAGRNPEQLARLTLEALAKSGQRGLLLTGWGGLRTDLAQDNVFVVDSAPHSWLFPRMAAVVHHGGAGITISFDHDIIDGAPAARFTQRLKELIESGYGLTD